MIKNIFFDFDGVLAESVHVKTAAFRQMFEHFGTNIAEQVEAHHRAHGGVSRFEKFRIWYRDFLGETITDEKVKQLAQQFSDLVVESVVAAPEILGATDFLDQYAGQLRCWVITGTPTPEIIQIVRRRGMSSYFQGLCGSPEKKDHWTEWLIKEQQLERSETLFLGDAMSDYKAALHSQLHFALRSYEENQELFKDYTGRRFSDFYDLETQLLQDGLLQKA